MGTGELIPASEDPILGTQLFGKQSAGTPCPRCGAALVEMRYEGVKILCCRACGGRLVANDAMQRILVRQILPITPELKEKAQRWKESFTLRPTKRCSKDLPDRLMCPLCSGAMVRNFYNVQYFIEVDRCYACSVTWFDDEELELLQALVEEASEELIAGGAGR